MTHAERWRHLVEVAFLLEEAAPDGVLALLDSALEVFPSGVDPVEDFEAYAVRRMLLAVRAAVAERCRPPV